MSNIQVNDETTITIYKRQLGIFTIHTERQNKDISD